MSWQLEPDAKDKAMPRSNDRAYPYNEFKDYIERRIALDTRARCTPMAMVAMAFTGEWKGRLRWLISLFH